MPEFPQDEDDTFNRPPQLNETGGQHSNSPFGEEPRFSNTTISEVTSDGRFNRLRSYLSRSVMDNSIRAFLVVDTALDEYNQSAAASDSLQDKLSLRYTAGMTVAGQAYERLRLPEVLGIAATTRVYREALENGWNSAAATAAAATILGAFVWGQQKIIGKNFVNTAKYFPNTYDTVNHQWPKTIQAIGDAIPSEKNRFSEGYGMFGLGTTPFIASSKAANPGISLDELKHIERRVTRRGAWFAAGVGALVLGVKSLSVHIPTKVGEQLVKRSDQLIDVASNPYLVAGSFMLWSAAKETSKQVRKK
jgi:hypothetical protein